MMSDYILRTKNISKKYGDSYALENVCVDIKRGQIYGLIGLNGAGKSTFMRAVMGLISLNHGEIELFGETSKLALARGRQRIGQCIETPALYPNMTAVENLEAHRIMSGVSDKSIVNKTLDVVRLAYTGKKKTKNFSLGMKQRLAIAIALITDPEFLILDEPANGLDPEGIIEIRELLRHFAIKRNLTILISSHLLDELSQIATHYGVIDHGRLVKQLSMEELELESRRYVKIITNDSIRAIKILKENFGITDCQKVSAKEIRVFEQVGRTGELNTMLVQNGIVVESIGATEQRLEDYFVNLIKK
jgi:ABC-2 type transport system ATP-binding protein